MTVETVDFSGVSSNVGECSYDPDTKVLEVSFQSGHSYTGTQVPQEVWESFRTAGSPGSFYNRQLAGRYGFPPRRGS
jgi:hypothetical protein